MAADFKISVKHNDARLAGGGSLSGFSGGTMEVWSAGTTPGNEMPTTAEEAPPAGALNLATFTFGTPAGALVSHVLVLTQPPDALILTSGTAYWVRFVDSEDDAWAIARCKLDGDTVTEASVVLSQLLLYLGGSVRLVSCVLG
jgi:hypothetical protein